MGRPTGAIASGPMQAARLSDAPSPEGAHAYFDLWAASPNCLHSYSLRADSQLDTLADTAPAAPSWVYDATIDAAKGTVDTVAEGSITTQLWIVDPTTTGTLTFVWDQYLGADWSLDDAAAAVPPKSYQVTRVSGSGTGINLETRNWKTFKGQLPTLTCIDWRNDAGTLGPGASTGADPIGQPCRNSDTIQPKLATFLTQAETWTRFVLHIVLLGLNDSGIDYDLCSLWLLDETQGPTQLYDQIPKSHDVNGIKGFAFEMNTSALWPVGVPAKSVYCRNFLMFRGLTDVTPLLTRPIH